MLCLKIFKWFAFLFIFFTTSFMLMVCLFYEKYRGIHVQLIVGIFILSYFVLQSSGAFLNYQQSKKRLKSFQEILTVSEEPSVCFVVVGYREDATYWENCLISLRNCQYRNVIGVYGFVDGNDKDDQFMYDIFEKIYDRELGNNKECVMLPHRGKRFAMYDGFRYVRQRHPNNDYVIIIDSDTVIDPHSTEALVSVIQSDDRIGCATGTLRIFNLVNLLTKIINARYAYAFDIERSAMSFFGSMNCCSGPFSIYRQNVLTDELLDDFINQKYCCVRVGPGDDRHLTNLVMISGYQSVQTSKAIAYTESPIQFTRFLNQQLRWMRSFYREQVWQIQAIPQQSLYLSLITTYEILFPFFILLGFFQKIFASVSNNILIHRAIYGAGILTLRTLFLVWMQNWDFRYLLNLLYFPLYFFFLLPIKIYAMLTCYQMGWITSSRHSILTNSTIETFIMSIILTGWFAFIVYYVYGFHF